MNLMSGSSLAGQGGLQGAIRGSSLNFTVGKGVDLGQHATSSRMSLPGLSLQGQGVPSSLLSDISSQLDDMQDMDPRFMKEYVAAIMILNATDPSKLEEFVKTMKAQLQVAAQHTQQASQLPSSAAGGQSVQSVEEFSVELEITTTQFNALFGSSTSASATTQANDGTSTTTANTQAGQFQVMAASVTESTIRVRISLSGGRVQTQPVNANRDPLTLDLNQNGQFDVADHRSFDVNADGKVDDTPFVSGGDAFLALDRDGNGQIDNGKELFGDQNGAANGYEELAKFDSNQDGQIDSQDQVYQELTLLGDFNKDGNLEQKSLADEGG